MNGRIRERDINMIVRLKENIEKCCIELKNIRIYKKECWIDIQTIRNGVTKENLRSKHKKYVEEEKKKIESIKRQHERLYILENRLGYV